MKVKSIIVSIMLLLPAMTMYGQKIKVPTGSPDFLKDQKKINVVYDYSNMGVGKFDKEEDYVNEKVEKLNEKEAGRGDEWKKNWIEDRKNRYEPQFEELFNKVVEKEGVKLGNFEDAEYTLIVKTTFTEPGFNVGVVRRDASTNMEMVFVKTGSTDPLMVMTMEKVPGRGGMGYDFDSGFRIQESYAKAGKELGKYLVKKKAF